MKIGVPKEIKNHESRVGLNTASVYTLTQHGHEVYIETNAGVNSGFTDSLYKEAGATILSTADEIFEISELIVKVKEPLKEEYPKIRAEQVVFTYFHFASSKRLTDAMIKSKAICIAYETVENTKRQLPLLTPMSEVAGRMSVQQGAKYLEQPTGGKGKLLGGVAGVAPANVLIIGAGVVGTEAAKMASGLGAQVKLLDINIERLRYLSEILPANTQCLYSSKETIENLIKDCDLIIGSVLITGKRAPHIITREMIHRMEKGTVLVDVAIDQGGCFETSVPTSHENPIYKVDDIVHYCVTNIPGAVPVTSTNALNNVTLPYILEIANKGWKKACQENKGLQKGLSIYRGSIIYPAIADTFNLPCAQISFE